MHSTNFTFTKPFPPFMHQDKSHFYPEGKLYIPHTHTQTHTHTHTHTQRRRRRRNQLKTSVLLYNKGVYMSKVFFFSFFNDFFLRKENLLSGSGFCKYFSVHICYTFISVKNSFHGNSSIYT